MKTNILLTAALATLLIAGCSKDNGHTQADNKGDKATVSLSASIGEMPASKVSYTYNGLTTDSSKPAVTLKWETGDRIIGYWYNPASGKEGRVEYLIEDGSISEETDKTKEGKNAAFNLCKGYEEPELESVLYMFYAPAKSTSDIVVNDHVPSIAVDLSSQEGTFSDIRKHTCLCSEKIEKVGLTVHLKFLNQFAIFCYEKFTGLNSSQDYVFSIGSQNIHNAGTLSYSASGTTASFIPDPDSGLRFEAARRISDNAGTDDNVCIAIPAGERQTITFQVEEKYVNESGTRLFPTYRRIYDFTKNNAPEISAGKCLITDTINVPSLVLPGEFTVSDTGRKVRFSRGNLYAIGTNDNAVYQFETKQYNFHTGKINLSDVKNIAYVDGDRTECPDNYWGLLGWRSTTSGYAIPPVDSQESPGMIFNDYGNEVGDGRTWFTLSRDEFAYLMNAQGITARTTLKTIRINGHNIKGLVLYPDGYSGDKTKTVYENYYDSHHPENSKNEWTVAENAGCVFLPAAGSIYKSSQIETYLTTGYYCTYWTSTREESGTLYELNVPSTHVNAVTNEHDTDRICYAVRLVTAVDAPSAE